MSQARQRLIDMVNGGMAGYWVERLSIESENEVYFRIRHGSDPAPILCYPKEGIRLTAITHGLSDEEIESLPVIDADSLSDAGKKHGKCLPISIKEMICLDKWTSWAGDGEEDRKRYNKCLETLNPELLPFKSVII